MWAPQDSYLPDNEPITVKSLVEWLTGMDHLFAGGMDELDWPEKADKANVDFFFGDFGGDTCCVKREVEGRVISSWANFVG